MMMAQRYTEWILAMWLVSGYACTLLPAINEHQEQ
jgi:hypothetical protein